MNKNMFARFIQNCDRTHFKDIALEKDEKLIPLKKIIVSRDNKRLYFIAVDEKDSCNYYRNQIVNLEMLNTNRDDFDYSIIISTKTDECFKVHINMEDGYSLYAYIDDVIRNYNAVSEAIPKYLDKYKGKNVVVKHNTDSAMYRTFNEEDDATVFPVTDSYVINDFDYVIFYDAVSPNIPCIKMYSNENKNIYACAMGVKLITDKVIFTADGEFLIEEV
ncbi:MAG: hypothetical protein ACI4JM_08315 [Oscillospiraceae bacterium]